MATPLKYLPPVTFSVTPQKTLNDVAAPSRAQDQQATVAAENAPLRIIFGEDRLGAQIAYALAYQGKLVLLCVWGLGEIDSIQAIEIDDKPMPVSVTATHYTGTAAQTVNSTLTAAFAAQSPGKAWSSALPGIAYSVLVVQPGLGAGFPRVSALIRGLKMFDPRNGPDAGTSSLENIGTCTGGGISYSFRAISAPTYTIQSGDTLSYDVWRDPRNPTDPYGAGGIEIEVSTTPFSGRDVPLVDQYGYSLLVPAPQFTPGVWATRTISLTPFVGKSVTRIMVVIEADTPGLYRACYRNIKITDGATTTRLSVWTSGAPPVNYDAAIARYSGVTTTEVQATQWSENPAIALSHFLSSSNGYGYGKSVDSVSAIAAANFCDEAVGAEERRLIGLTLDTVQSDKSIVDVLRTYAGCFVVGLSEPVVKIVPDKPRSAVSTLSFAAGQIIAYGGIELRDVLQAPTFINVQWRDTTSKPWRDTFGPGAYAAGVTSGSAGYVPSQVALPGIRRRSQAAREEIERVNKLNLSDLSCWIDVFDELLAIEVGDRVDVILPDFGASAKPMVVYRMEGELGRYRLSLVEYDPAVYSDAVVAEPTWSDTTLPTPATPPAPIGPLGLTEEGYVSGDGSIRTRIKATWAEPVYPFLASYRVTIKQSGNTIATLTAASTEARTGTMQEGLTYQVDVQVVSGTGAVSSALSGSILVTGATTLPGNPTAWITAVEAGGTVFLAWVPVAGSTRYRIKYGAQGGTYAGATRIDDLDGTTYQAAGIPAGPQRIWLAALNRTGTLESAAPIYRDLTVTIDPSLLVTTKTFTTPTLVSMTFYQPRGKTGAWITNFADGIGYGHSDTNNATGTFADLASTVFAHPHTAGTSSWESESWDVSSSVSGSWTTDASVTALSGSATIKIRLSPDNSAWTDYTYTGSPITATGRYARVRVETTGTMQIEQPVSAAVTVAARRDPNAGTITTSAGSAVTVTLANKYIAAKSISLTPKGTTAKTATFDNLVLGVGTNTFDVYAFNAAGTQIAADVSWSFEGI